MEYWIYVKCMITLCKHKLMKPAQELACLTKCRTKISDIIYHTRDPAHDPLEVFVRCYRGDQPLICCIADIIPALGTINPKRFTTPDLATEAPHLYLIRFRISCNTEQYREHTSHHGAHPRHRW